MRDWGYGKPPARNPITRPAHYVQGKIEVLDAIMQLGLDPCEANVLKYICRHRMKGGKDDIRKAMTYCQMMLDNYESWYGGEKDVGDTA